MNSAQESRAAALSPAISRRRVLEILMVGFGLVILLLAAAAYSNMQRSRAIQAAANRLMLQNQVTDRLMDGLEREQIAATNLLLRLSRLEPSGTQRTPDPSTIQLLREEMDRLEKRLLEIGAEGRASMPEVSWDDLMSAVSSYAGHGRMLLAQSRVVPDEVDQLEEREQQLLRSAGHIEKEDAARSLRAEQTIQNQSLELERDARWLLGACLVLALVCALMTIWLANHSWRRMEAQSEELTRVSWHMIQSQEESARRFSHEMHDEFGQSLTGLRAMMLGLKNGEFEVRRNECIRLLDETIANARELAQLLRPVILDDFGLDAGLRWLIEGFGQRTRIQTDYESNLDGRLSEELETHLFRIAQEALTNVARHSGAKRVSIQLHADASFVRLSVEDNGRGIGSLENESPSLGLVGMRARARQLNGEMEIGSGSQGGLRVSISVPRRNAQKDTNRQLHFSTTP